MCAHVLTFACECASVQLMHSMARLRRPLNLTLDPDLLAELDRWIEEQELKTTRSAVVELALRRFLTSTEKGGRK